MKRITYILFTLVATAALLSCSKKSGGGDAPQGQQYPTVTAPTDPSIESGAKSGSEPTTTEPAVPEPQPAPTPTIPDNEGIALQPPSWSSA